MGASQSSQDFQPNLDENNYSIKPQYQESNVQPIEKTSHSELSDHAKPMEKTRKTLQLPHNCEAILKDADSPVNKSSMDNLVSQLHAGVFLNQKRKKYWVDKKLNKNCFMLFARELSITWGGDYRYWHWCYQKDTTSDEYIEVAELLQVCWLEVHTKFDIAKLSPGTLYQVVAMVMLRDEAYGWEDPVNFRLTLPNGHKVERKETLMNKPKGLWIEIPVGEFTTSSGNSGELDIYFHEYTAGTWKGGLILKGVAILPKN